MIRSFLRIARKSLLPAVAIAALAASAPAQPAKAPAAPGGSNIWVLKPKFSYNQSAIAVMPFNALNATVE